MGNSQNQEDQQTNIDYFKELEDLPYNYEIPYFIVLIGPSQSGKSSFLKMLIESDEQKELIKIGNGLKSCTRQFEIYQVNNEKLFGKRGALVLDTVGFGDTTGELDDITILSLLHCKLMNGAIQAQLKIDAVFLFVSCKGLIQTKSLLSDMRILFKDQVNQNAAIIVTKRNLLTQDDEYTYEEIFELIMKDQQELNINFPVIDFFTSYTHRKQGVVKPSDHQSEKQTGEINKFLINKKGCINLINSWNIIKREAKLIQETFKKDDINKKYGELCEEYRLQYQGKFGYFKALICYFTTFKSPYMVLREKAVKEIEHFYQNEPGLAQKATEMALYKEIKKQKQAKFDNQLRTHILSK